MCYIIRYRVPLSTSNWAKYIDKEITVKPLYPVKAVEYLPNRLTFFNSKIHYKEENYLKVKTVLFKYTTPPYSKGSVHQYIALVEYIAFLYSEHSAYFKFHYITQLPLVL